MVQGLSCTGSHGICADFWGQYANETDIVENLYIDVSLVDSSDGARIKVCPDIETNFQTLLNGGGGLGRVRNMTYDLFKNVNDDRAITITQCHGQRSQSLCYKHPGTSRTRSYYLTCIVTETMKAKLTIEDITIKNLFDTTYEALDPQAGTLICNAPDRCSNIRAGDITAQVPSGNVPSYARRYVNENLLRFNCTETAAERDVEQG